MTNNTETNIPSLKSINGKSETIAKGLGKDIALAITNARDALLYTMFAMNEKTQDFHRNSEPLNRLHTALMTAAVVRPTKEGTTLTSALASKFVAWVHASAPCWRYDTKNKVFRLVRSIKGVPVPYEMNEAIFEVDFDKYYKPTKKNDAAFDQAKLLRAIGNLKAKATGAKLDFDAAIAALNNVQTQAQEQANLIVAEKNKRNRKAEKQILPVAQQNEAQAEAAQVVDAEAPKAEEAAA